MNNSHGHSSAGHNSTTDISELTVPFLVDLIDLVQRHRPALEALAENDNASLVEAVASTNGQAAGNVRFRRDRAAHRVVALPFETRPVGPHDFDLEAFDHFDAEF
ncbi:MAG: hypothetical protein JWQ43_3061 [Glaciihabitans sp.]|nr:hypothetical protein [Glaciihabitans sp.]